MPAIRLTWAATRDPDFDGFRFFVEAGDVFDVNDFCDAYNLHHRDIDHNDIANAQAAASNLAPSEWLEVTYAEMED